MTKDELQEYLTADLPKGLGFCGCGDPREASEAIRNLLDAYDRKAHPWPNAAPFDEVAWAPWRDERRKLEAEALPAGAWGQIALYWLTTCGLLEHGGSVSGSWLTPQGEEVLVALREHGENLWED